MLLREYSKISVGIDELLYAGGLCSYLESLNSSESDRLLQPETQQTKTQQEQNPTCKTIKDKPIKRELVSSETNGSRQLETQPSKPQQERKPLPKPTKDRPIKRKLVSDIPNYISLGNDCHKKTDYQGAISNYNEAIQLNLNLENAYLWRGCARFAIEDKLGAIEDSNQAIKINPTHATAYYNRGYAHSKLKDKRAALEDFRRAADLFQQQGEQANYQKALERIRRFDIIAD